MLCVSGLGFLNNPVHACIMHAYAGQILRMKTPVCVRKPLPKKPNFNFLFLCLH